ncbi:Adenylate cyclase [Alloactinosynnema sp. L-07]|uniref:CHAD domain-containing protein n=1 Tax=Alloactinosynnema sp. L-07 TaxID=1653480 RepID=UPI00065F05B3|nr:CHAD domain-containing protein [Alloactinosynnema sp. L-07]CRK61679.1 Adenylate cyclase [Alloactinosynnema sp. L-07]
MTTAALSPVDLGLPEEPLTAGGKDGAAAHVRARLDEQARTLLDNTAGARVGTDIEHVHQLRVAVRRSRAALKADPDSIPGAEALNAELKWLGNSLGAVRDLDVQLEHMHAQTESFDEAEKAAVEQLLAGLLADRRAARRSMLATLRSKRYQAVMHALASAVLSTPLPGDGDEEPEDVPLVDVIRKPHKKLMKDAEALGEDPPDDDLHALRVRGKRLRYAAEMAESSSKKKIRTLVKATKEFQDILGDHQDAVIAEETVRRLLADLGDGIEVDVVFVAGRLVERERARKADRRARWRDALAEVDDAAKAVLG